MIWLDFYQIVIFDSFRYECMTLIDKDEADIVNLDAEDLYLGGRLHDLEPFAMEEYNGS